MSSVIPDMRPCVAITAKFDLLICHHFASEAEALKTLPFIKRWKRETFREKYCASYHSPAAEKYWFNRRFDDPIHSVNFYYEGGKRVKITYMR